MTDHDESTGAMTKAEQLSNKQKELEKLQIEVDDLKPTTPTGTIDWYVKWVSMMLAVCGIFLISANLLTYGQVAYIISSIGWIYVGIQWGDRAIMIGSSIAGTAVAMNLVEKIVV